MTGHPICAAISLTVAFVQLKGLSTRQSALQALNVALAFAVRPHARLPMVVHVTTHAGQEQSLPVPTPEAPGGLLSGTSFSYYGIA
jgi:hypothetical protein